MKKRRIIIAVISIIVVAAMVLFDMLYMKKDKKEELPQEEKKVEEIVWITESSIEGVQSEMEEALNALLKKRGCEYKVRFVCFPMETYEEDVAEYLENNSADIIYSNLRVVGDDSNQYYSFYKNGYLQNLEKIREDEKFYDAYSEKTWEHMEINGEIYGIPSYSYEGNGLYYVFNQQYLDKYNVDISQVTGDLQTLYPILTELSEKEKDNKAFVPLHSYEYMIYAPEYTEILDTIRVKEGMEKPIAENLLNNEQVKESVLLLNEFHKNGLLKEGSANTLANGNFFVMLMYADEICRERGTFSIQFLGGTKDYQIYSVKGEDGVTCYQFDYKKEVSKEISLYDIPGRIIGADETGFYYNSGIDYPSAVYRYHFETGENEVFVSKEEAKAAYGKDVFSLSLWDVREEGILFKIWYGEDQRLFLKEADSGKLRQLSLSEELLKEDFVLNGMLFKNEEGLGFEYTQYLDMDQINWYGYISWEDLLSDENNVKVLIEPRMTSRGYPLDEDGNVIGAQE